MYIHLYIYIYTPLFFKFPAFLSFWGCEKVVFSFGLSSFWLQKP